MKIEEIKCTQTFYTLGGIKILTIGYGEKRIEYNHFSNDDCYFILYENEDEHFHLDKLAMPDLSLIPLDDENEAQWFQLQCVMDSTIDLYEVRAIQEYCKRAVHVLGTIITHEEQYPFQIEVHRH